MDRGSYGTVTTQDFLEASKARALAQHKEIVQAYTFLIRAMTRGWEGFNDIKDHVDYAYLKQANVGKWSDLLTTAEEIELDR